MFSAGTSTIELADSKKGLLSLQYSSVYEGRRGGGIYYQILKYF
jgi:hypothetical protein